MAEVGEVTVAVLPARDRLLLDRLLQLYLYDFSEFAGVGTCYGEVDEAGHFEYQPGLDDYWRDPGRIPLIIRADGRVAGFALVNEGSPRNEPLDHALAEFFILRKFRRTGIGGRAAHAIFRMHPGRWELAIAGYNAPALAFWRALAKTLPGSEECPGDPERWPGTVLRFTSTTKP